MYISSHALINQSQFRISNLHVIDITDVSLYPPICSPVRLRESAVYCISCLWHALHVGYSDRTATLLNADNIS